MRKEPIRVFALTLMLGFLFVTGCVSGNKAEVNAIKIEKQSKAKEFDQYIRTTGGVLDYLRGK